MERAKLCDKYLNLSQISPKDYKLCMRADSRINRSLRLLPQNEAVEHQREANKLMSNSDRESCNYLLVLATILLPTILGVGALSVYYNFGFNTEPKTQMHKLSLQDALEDRSSTEKIDLTNKHMHRKL